MMSAATERTARAWVVLDAVPDPEVPVLSVRDLGMVRGVDLADDGTLDVVLTPTYSGCPATEMIERSVIEALDAAGLGPVRVTLRRAPAWTTDWISDEGRRKLREYGIAPPTHVVGEAVPIRMVRGAAVPAPSCPHCGSADTEQISAFGSTACKALWRCRTCGEPFDYFKPI